MKKILLISLALTGLCANAQSFEHRYGTSESESVTDAAFTQSGGDDGYFMVGTSANNGAGNPGRELVVARTDIDGRLTCTFCFENHIKMWATAAASSGDHYTLNNAKFAERRSSNPIFFGRFEVVTEIQVGSNHWLSYTELDQTGTIAYGPIDLILPGYALQLGAVTASTDLASIYITGNTTNGSKKIFIIKYNVNTKTITWSNLYDVTSTIAPPFPAVASSPEDYALDIIEDGTNNRVIVVGRVEEVINGTLGSPYTNKFGLLLTANAASGASIRADVYGVRNTSGNTENNFNSIKASAKSPAGFIISGHSDKAGSVDFWAVRLSSGFAVDWNNVIDYNYAAAPAPINDDERGRDIVERNNSSVYEYYQVGNVVAGNWTGAIQQDIAVYKLDDTGVPMGTDPQFTYGGVYGDGASVIDLAGPSNNDGFVVFGEHQFSSTASDNDFYAVHAYFTGHTKCTEYIANSASYSTGHGIFKANAGLSYSSLTFYQSGLYGETYTISDNEDCYGASTNMDANNDLVIQNPSKEDTKYENIKVGPNPTLQGSITTTLFIEADKPEQVTVSVYDMLGKQIYSNAFDVKKGKNNLDIDLSSYHLKHGMYSIKINGTSTNQSRMLLVE